MQGDRWSRLSPLLDELLELTGPSRDARLARIAREDGELAAELKKMMSLEDERPDFLAQPLVDANLFAPQAGQEIGPYRLVAPLGEGGMGQVWLAMRSDGLYERRVALKLLRPGLGDAGLRARFTRERQILARLGHAHIARLLDAGISQDGQPYLALDYVRGDPITDYAKKHGLDVRTRLHLFAQVCAAVSHAHANLVVHRDLKPSNILVTPAGEVCLLDFGIAKLLDQAAEELTEITQTDSRAFTLHYAAPEQLRREAITTMTDVYSLGVVLYELLTDCIPYDLERQTDAAWEEAILGAEPIRPSAAVARLAKESGLLVDRRRVRHLSGDLDRIILKTLDKVPEHRYPSVEALAQDLRRYLDGQPVQARSQSFGYRARKYLRRHALAVGLGGAATAVLTITLAIVTWQANRAVQEASRAQAMQDFVIALFENTGNASHAQGLDVRALLDAGVRRADTELATQPQARAELLGLIARLRSGLGDDRETLRLLDRQQEIIHSLGPSAPPTLQLEAAALRGRSLRELGRAQDCLTALSPLLSKARDEAHRAPLQTAEFESQLGRCHRQLNGRDVARDLFGESLKLRRGNAGSGALEAESQTDLALLQLDDGQTVEGISALRDALAKLRASVGERNALGVDIWRSLGEAYDRQDNLVESEAAYRQALDIALGRFGTQHPRTTAVQQRLAEELARVGKLQEAERLLELAEDSVGQRWGSDSLQFAEIVSLRGRLALDRDRAADAETALTEAVRLWREHTQLSAHAWDLCWLAMAQSDQAKDALAESSGRECVAVLRSKSGEHPGTALALLGEAALDRGDRERAQQWLGQVDAIPVNARDPAVALARARVAVLSDAPDTDARLAASLQLLPDDAAHRRGRWQLQALQAAHTCRVESWLIGQTLRAQALAAAKLGEPEHLRLQRRLQRMSADCPAAN
ncbi:serine/threonine-protein kinase [Arenimonas oryziterrae]|uniref:Protein kinase domain-containing protein n=1 Tax=Arenimonas oryziterrae DSM 21050 = YC6267 TaxID=1121015 RepID=A0A091BIK2_9GAMM|nr:serine/threonine-protein kinase [Arenimonas oryziterrae]KFN44175.1 hypothetical protein N789_07090 [Arenimonas oryziterrae DSM 21050 = YC6267]